MVICQRQTCSTVSFAIKVLRTASSPLRMPIRRFSTGSLPVYIHSCAFLIKYDVSSVIVLVFPLDSKFKIVYLVFVCLHTHLKVLVQLIALIRLPGGGKCRKRKLSDLLCY
jgi:hypothetical protein